MSKKKIAFLFPGQGSQYPGMGKDFFDTFSIAKETFQEADDLLGENLSQIIFEGPESRLAETHYSQLGIFVTSIAMLRTVWQQLPDFNPSIVAGLSLGEYSALVSSGRMTFSDGIYLVKERARLMTESCLATAGTMAAVLGMERQVLDAALQGISGVWVANYNSPGQIVISGTLEGVEKGLAILKEKGAKRVIPLAVQGAFHSPLMALAQEGLTPYVQKTPFQESDISQVFNVVGRAVKNVDEMRQCLIQQVAHSIEWDKGIQSMEGVQLFCEIGCGKTLSGLNRKIGVSAPTHSIEKVNDLEGIFACSSC